MPTRPYMADDFDSIRKRMEEIQTNRDTIRQQQTDDNDNKSARNADVEIIWMQRGSTIIFRPQSPRTKTRWRELMNPKTGIARGRTDEDFGRVLEERGYTHRKVDNETDL